MVQLREKSRNKYYWVYTTVSSFLVILLAPLDGYNKILWTGCLGNNRYSFLTVLEARKSKIKAPATLMSGEGPFPGP